MGSCVGCGAQMNPHLATCPGVPIFCPLCEKDVGPVFPSLEDDRLPAVVHHANGTHTFDWEAADG